MFDIWCLQKIMSALLQCKQPPKKISQIINFHQTILDVEKRSKNIGRPLCTAAQYESLRCMCLLLKSGFNVEVRLQSEIICEF